MLCKITLLYALGGIKIENKHTSEDLKIMQAWPLERKIQVTQTRIIEWYQHWEGKVYVSFSGGKDSTVLLDLVRRIYPEVEAVFFDTGLEYPEIRRFVKTIDNVVWLRPRIAFPEVIRKYGYPIIGKEVSDKLYWARKGSKWAVNQMNGKSCDGSASDYCKQYEKWKWLMDAPFLISSNCCDVMKKEVAKKYDRKNATHPIVGTMASESSLRKRHWLISGCNSFKEGGQSKPISFWTEQDVLQYLMLTGVPYCELYGDIIEEKGKLKTTGADRTGCMFCMFGAHLEKEPNRFQRMKETHPKQYEYCMKPVEEGGLGLATVLDYIGVKYE